MITDDDYYWHVPATARYDPYQAPSELTVGHLTDDWREVQRMVSGATPALGYGLVWLAAILRRVGEKALA